MASAAFTITINARTAAALTGIQALGTALGHLTYRLVTALPRLAAMATRAVEFGDHLEKASRRVGITAEKLAGFHIAAKLSDTELSALNEGMRYFAAKGFGGDFGSALINTARRMESIASGTERARLAVQMFGRSSLNIMPLLTMGADTLQSIVEYGEKFYMMPKNFAEQSARLNDTWTLIRERVFAFGIYITGQLMPQLQRLVDRLLETLMSGQWIERLQSAVSLLAKAISELVDLLTDKARLFSFIDQWLFFGLGERAFWKKVGKPITDEELQRFRESAPERRRRAEEALQNRAMLQAWLTSPKLDLSNLAGVLGRLTLAAAPSLGGVIGGGFRTLSEARAVQHQVNLQRESRDLLRTIAQALQGLRSDMKDALL